MALEQHPIPQNISTYEFRLVGDMTLKQFFQLAGGIVIGLLLFRLPLPVIIKYPLVFLSVLVGVLMAFIPINGRPFTQWLMAFIRAIYAPTEFVWRPVPEEAIVSATPPTSLVSAPPQPSISPAFSTPAPTPTSSAPLAPSPSPEALDKDRIASLPPLPIVTFAKKAEEPSKPTQTVYSKMEKPEPPADPTPTPPPPSSTTSPAPSSPPPPPVPSEPSPVIASSAPSTPTLPPTTTPVQPTPPAAAPQAQTTNLVPPPTLPNILAGIVTDSQGKAIDSAIVEIIDAQTGIPARALRTNRTGLFQIATPLSPGTYQIQTEKENYTFSPISIKVANTILNPIVVTATSA